MHGLSMFTSTHGIFRIHLLDSIQLSNGPKSASLYFEKQLNHSVPDSTCTKFCDAYNKMLLKPGETKEETELPNKTIGMLLMVCDID